MVKGVEKLPKDSSQTYHLCAGGVRKRNRSICTCGGLVKEEGKNGLWFLMKYSKRQNGNGETISNDCFTEDNE